MKNLTLSKTVLILIAIALNSCVNKVDLLLGDWTCDSGACPDEEISFSLEEGKFVYNSWLHSRPSVTGGSWKKEGKILTVNSETGISDRWLILEVTPEKMRLQDQDTSEIALFSRIKP